MLLADLVKDRIRQSLFCADAEVWIELQHTLDKIKNVGIGVWEELLKFVAVFLLTELVHILQGCVLSNERPISGLGGSKCATYVLHLILRADMKLRLAVIVVLVVPRGNRRERIAGVAGQENSILNGLVRLRIHDFEELGKDATCAPDVHLLVVLLLHKDDLGRAVEA